MNKILDTWRELLNITSAYQKRAFETGFYAGTELIRTQEYNHNHEYI